MSGLGDSDSRLSRGGLDGGSSCRNNDLITNTNVSLSNLRNLYVALSIKKLASPMSLSFEIARHMSRRPENAHVPLLVLRV